MKKRTMMLLVAVLATVTSLVAQPEAKKPALTEEQKMQLQELREDYSPKIKEIKDELRLKAVEQKTLLASQEIDEKAIYANIDEMGKLKAALHAETSTYRAEMKEVCPNAGKMMKMRQAQKKSYKGQGVKQGQRSQGQAMRQGQGGKQGQGVKQGQRPQRQHLQAGQGQQIAKGHKSKQQRMAAHQRAQKKQGMHKQGRQGQRAMFAENCKLTDEQKTAMADIKTKHFWGIQETQNELALLKAKNTTAEERQASFADANALMTKLAKQRMALKLDIMSELTEEQRIQMITRMKDNGAKGKQGRGNRSPRQHRNR